MTHEHDPSIETAARQYREWLGPEDAIKYLIEQAEAAEAVGDSAAGRDWRAIANAVESERGLRS